MTDPEHIVRGQQLDTFQMDRSRSTFTPGYIDAEPVLSIRYTMERIRAGMRQGQCVLTERESNIASMLAFLLAAVMFSCEEPPSERMENLAVEPMLINAIDSIMTTKADGGFVGVALVALGAEVVFNKAYSGKGASIDTSTAFYIASLTKQFTAAAMMKLVEHGKVNLGDSLGRFFPLAPADKRAITIMQLLSHTTGIGEVDVEDLTDRDAAVNRILAAPLDRAVGEFQYQNTNFQLAAAIIEQVAHESWYAFVRSQLLDPAGMHHTGFWGHEDEVNVIVSPVHDSIRSYPTNARTFRDGRPFANWGMCGNGGMFSTASDMYRWSQTLLNDRVLSAASREMLFKPVVTVRTDTATGTSVHYALGWVVEMNRGERVEVRHTGHGDWTNNSMLRMLENGAVVFTIAEDEGPNTEPMAYAAADALDSLMRTIQAAPPSPR